MCQDITAALNTCKAKQKSDRQTLQFQGLAGDLDSLAQSSQLFPIRSVGKIGEEVTSKLYAETSEAFPVSCDKVETYCIIRRIKPLKRHGRP